MKRPESGIQTAIMGFLDRALPAYRHDAKRLVSRIAVDANGCWNWQGAKVRGYGYSWCSALGAARHTHRIALACIGEEIDQKVACHKCDNPSCCNPDHLFLGDHADNVADCIAKGRNSLPPKKNWADVMKRERHHWQRLSREQVLEIREARKNGVPCRPLAEKYGVTEKHISRVATGRHRWAHL